jgi:hypothetical protein
MTFPIPPLKPETESLEMTALSPSSKVFVAATVIFIGSVVAMIHAQIPVASLANLPNEVVDQNLVAAPLPDVIDPVTGVANSGVSELQPDLRIALAELKRESLEPTIAAGNVKYTQAYPQPVLATPNYPQSNSAADITEPKPLSAPNQLTNDSQNGTKVKSVDFRPMQVTDNVFNTENNDVDSRKTSKPVPTVAPSTEVSDSMLPLFQFAENLKSSRQSESIPSAPVDIFQPNNEMVPITPAPSTTLVPLTRAE